MECLGNKRLDHDRDEEVVQKEVHKEHAEDKVPLRGDETGRLRLERDRDKMKDRETKTRKEHQREDGNEKGKVGCQ